ncbi:MAG: tetratricopeptide repeat protein [Planctomycetes bacterium]|nr:tetratricopeptide repeat protein [Planctomycetota bacterium]
MSEIEDHEPENESEVENADQTAVAVLEQVPPFDLVNAEIPGFPVLQAARASVFQNAHTLASFRRTVEGLESKGEVGRRKGLGHWMLGAYDKAVAQLADYGNDDVASFTRARALMALGRQGEALPTFERLTKSYPDNPRPRAGLLEAQFERDLAAGKDAEALASALLADVERAPHNFEGSAEGCYLKGRAYEARRDWERALDAYNSARSIDPTLRANLFRAAHLAERCGLDALALDLYQGLAQLKPIDAEALMNLGILYEDMGRDQEAAACYEVIVRSHPTDTRARLFLSDARSAVNSYYDEDMERKEDRLNQILRIPITDFELSVRARNCLSKMNINTLGDLVMRTEQELLAFKNFGETSLNEIKEILHSKGLRLGMTREEAVSSVEAASRRTGGAEKNDVLDLPISELQLSIRARRTVEALGCLTLGDITKHSAQELVGMPNFGQTSLQELRNRLGERGLKLSGE